MKIGIYLLVSFFSWLRLPWLAIAFLSACGTVQNANQVEHGFSVKNVGKEVIHKVVIEYGAIKIPFCNPLCLPGRGGGGWNAPMMVEDYMDVSWVTSNGKSHSVRVPVRAKIKNPSRLSTINLQFGDTGLVVQQWLHYENPSIVEFEKLPLYP